jgi:hypothetical protein
LEVSVTGNGLAAVTIGSPAERLRSTLAAAESLTLQTPGHRADLVGRHTVPDGRVTVELPITSCMARQVAHDGEVLAVIELTDLAPVLVRDRVRARGTLTGRLIPADARVPNGELAAALALDAAEFTTADGAEPVDPAAFAAARPDPLVAAEAGMLSHLNDCHRAAIDQLSRLIPPSHLHGAVRIHPLRLDRHGIVLRLEFPRRNHDVRLAFPASLHGPDQFGVQLQALLAQAGRCRPHPRR